ncbi:MAG: polysaccharide deacetylase family protein [Deltaproteobacteria bacterium]|nr:polysaccharide deacetylase family protein [Deltaproteobacteria bacterium]MDQ3297730.1 polysaccharide deacetylase family protein [Myxococcota bacterium]
MRSWLGLVAIGFFALQVSCVEDEDSCESEDCHAEEDGALFEQAYDEAMEEGKEDGTDCSGVRVPDRTGFNKRVALTFDDGPNPATTPKVMEILRRHNAPAAFFTNGSRYAAAGAPELAKQIAADPLFILANHSHRHLNLAQQSATTVAREIDRTDALIRGAGETPRFFRFPFGSATCSAKQAVTSRGYRMAGWHVDSADWCYAAGGGTCKASTFRHVPDAMRGDMKAYVLQQVRANNGGVVLFHDIHASTANALEGILIALANEGYTFVRLDDTATWPKLNGSTAPVPNTKFIGDACATSADCAFMAGGGTGRCHAAKFCTITCAGSCPDQVGKAPTFCMADAASGSIPKGMCVSKVAAQNQSCAALPGTIARSEARFIGVSGASPATANVCAPR